MPVTPRTSEIGRQVRAPPQDHHHLTLNRCLPPFPLSPPPPPAVPAVPAGTRCRSCWTCTSSSPAPSPPRRCKASERPPTPRRAPPLAHPPSTAPSRRRAAAAPAAAFSAMPCEQPLARGAPRAAAALCPLLPHARAHTMQLSFLPPIPDPICAPPLLPLPLSTMAPCPPPDPNCGTRAHTFALPPCHCPAAHCPPSWTPPPPPPAGRPGRLRGPRAPADGSRPRPAAGVAQRRQRVWPLPQDAAVRCRRERQARKDAAQGEGGFGWGGAGVGRGPRWRCRHKQAHSCVSLLEFT
jgi:hypothetical protein